MYAELVLKYKEPIEAAKVLVGIREVIGVNQVKVGVALAGTPLASVPSMVRSALGAEQVLGTTVVYFMEGNDMIKVHIAARSLAEVRKQCARIARQLSGKIGSVLLQMRASWFH